MFYVVSEEKEIRPIIINIYWDISKISVNEKVFPRVRKTMSPKLNLIPMSPKIRNMNAQFHLPAPVKYLWATRGPHKTAQRADELF